MNFDKVSKIPHNISNAKNITDVKKKGNIIIITYEQEMIFTDGEVSLKEDRVISLIYPKKIRGFEIQVDEDDNLFVAVFYKPKFTIFGWSFSKEKEENV
jgi:hypothetical protein